MEDHKTIYYISLYKILKIGLELPHFPQNIEYIFAVLTYLILQLVYPDYHNKFSK